MCSNVGMYDFVNHFRNLSNAEHVNFDTTIGISERNEPLQTLELDNPLTVGEVSKTIKSLIVIKAMILKKCS